MYVESVLAPEVSNFNMLFIDIDIDIYCVCLVLKILFCVCACVCVLFVHERGASRKYDLGY